MDQRTCGFIHLVTKKHLYADSQTDGVSVQMCIPAARGGMEPLNEAQQECKQKGPRVGARGRLSVGPEEEDEQRKSLANSPHCPPLFCAARGSEVMLLELETVGKSRLSRVEGTC